MKAQSFQNTEKYDAVTEIKENDTEQFGSFGGNLRELIYFHCNDIPSFSKTSLSPPWRNLVWKDLLGG